MSGVMERLIVMQCLRHREDLARDEASDTSFYEERGLVVRSWRYFHWLVVDPVQTSVQSA